MQNMNVVKRTMKALNINQAQLAKKLKVNPSQISLWKNGILSVPKKHVEKMQKLQERNN